ncbi:hypothetical protein CPG38_06855 [Malaciobacter marinus]|uniref:PH domain-containing protein n=1 Tax=Malaciobacter marinus TaxID=505249 RepID=UPI000C0721B4|nr:PH domain-containing protein [Malaciobacter marinus]PHO12561.1 hypothetical protein CPG38_06855 [Malaciobacter marinus]
MKYIMQSLSQDEKIVKEFKFHWILKVSVILLFLMAIITFGVSLLFAIPLLIKLLTTEQAVTNKRVVFKTGLISRKTEEMRLNKIETIEINQSVLGRILGYGSVKVTGTGISNLLFKGIDDPINVKKTIESISND